MLFDDASAPSPGRQRAQRFYQRRIGRTIQIASPCRSSAMALGDFVRTVGLAVGAAIALTERGPLLRERGDATVLRPDHLELQNARSRSGWEISRLSVCDRAAASVADGSSP